MAIQETKIDSSIATSELFPESNPYNVYRKDRYLHGGGVMLLVNKDISHMPITELENNSESVWVKVFANKTSLMWQVDTGNLVVLARTQYDPDLSLMGNAKICCLGLILALF